MFIGILIDLYIIIYGVSYDVEKLSIAVVQLH
jgi:hypothetical protein